MEVNAADYRTEYDFGDTHATVANVKTSEVTVVNERQENLKILKRSVNSAGEVDENEPLNAQFKLEKLRADGKTADQSFAAAEGWTYQDNTDGMTVNAVVAGKYRLTELKAPDGYQQLAQPIEFEISGALTTEIKLSEFAKLSYDADTHTLN
ncbi:prealbumin-like fold domain-containing protein [Arcanobacterium hippocoleae]